MVADLELSAWAGEREGSRARDRLGWAVEERPLELQNDLDAGNWHGAEGGEEMMKMIFPASNLFEKMP